MKTLIFTLLLTSLSLAQAESEKKSNQIMENSSDYVEVIITKAGISKKDFVFCEVEIKNISANKLTIKCYKIATELHQLKLLPNQDFIAFYKEKKSADSEFVQLFVAPGSYESYNGLLPLNHGQAGKFNIEFSSSGNPSEKVYKLEFFLSVEEFPKKLKVITKNFILDGSVPNNRH